jgi:hypothetical protein
MTRWLIRRDIPHCVALNRFAMPLYADFYCLDEVQMLNSIRYSNAITYVVTESPCDVESPIHGYATVLITPDRKLAILAFAADSEPARLTLNARIEKQLHDSRCELV